ncbi:MAG: serine O-acetyltransferase [Rhodomicrobiaceae bacterium]
MQLLIRIHKVSRWFHQKRFGTVSRIIDGIIRVLYAARIPASAKIDPTAHFSHNGLTVVITKEAEIGPGCMIGIQVLLGSRWPEKGGPILERNVLVHSGAKIIGPVRIGEGSVIGANAVVLNDIAANSLAVGVPARIKKNGIDVQEYLQPREADAA